MGLFDAIFGKGGDDNLKKALRAYKDVSLPELKELNPELYSQVVALNPELETSVQLGPSAMDGITTDPMLQQAQLDALRQLQNIGSGEEQLSDTVSKMQVEQDVNRNLKGNTDAIMQNLATRGMSGGGSELVARQLQAQGAANRQADMDMQIRAQAQQRALQALMQSGELAGSMEQQSFNRQATKADSQDAISRFNAQNQQQVQGRNVQSKNQAQQWNATNAQQTADRNVGVRNAAQEYNVGLDQQNFNNQMALADAKSGVRRAQAQNDNDNRDREAGFVGGIISSGAAAYASDVRVKENISPLDSAEFLKHLDGYEYDYKDPEKHGEGPQVGIMAQDLEKVFPQAVMTDEEGVKRVDHSKLTGPMLAALADMNKRLEDVEGEE
jgi:hypothetical protein